MSILFLSELFYPHGGGAELATYLWAEALSKSGFNIRTVTNRFPNEPAISKDGNMTIYRVPIFDTFRGMKYSTLARFGLAISDFIRNLLLWADLIYIPRYWYSAIPLAKAYKKPVVTHFHDYVPVCPLASVYDFSKNEICVSSRCSPRCIVADEETRHGKSSETVMASFLGLTVWQCIRRLVPMSDATICVSNAQRDLILRHMPSLVNKCYTVYNLLPGNHEVETTGRDMGYFGGRMPLKGFDVLCHALRLTTTRFAVHMTGLVHGSEKIGSSKVVFHERLDQQKYRELYKKISTVIVPSVWPEPFAYVVSEALLSRRLLIASDTGGIPEQVENCRGTFLFRRNDAQGLAKLIDVVNALDHSAAAELGAKNREAFLRKFRNRDSLQTFLKIIHEAINS